ncbi:hypothetical protein NYF13_02530 [Amycolatopsis sp. PS_44_ISF1]|nr:hypothetical protein [Amycolatopsis sp. PS_44_ISF1]
MPPPGDLISGAVSAGDGAALVSGPGRGTGRGRGFDGEEEGLTEDESVEAEPPGRGATAGGSAGSTGAGAESAPGGLRSPATFGRRAGGVLLRGGWRREGGTTELRSG